MAHTRVLIIGSGPAGLTAAIYAARAQLSPIVIEGEPSSTTDQPGGQLMITTEVENFPGFPEGVQGPELMGRMREQAVRFGANLQMTKVVRLDTSVRPFHAWVREDGDTPSITADTVIVATGARSLMLGVPGEERLMS
ncbi:MAG: FAD-dependent oxidoreductase, partial [Acidobacteria bacterium]|nr:FAD-dependent oxidoreductase [Acidobacteriota bacterium]